MRDKYKCCRITCLIWLLMGFSFSGIAQEKIFLHKSDKMVLGMPLNIIDSIYFSTDQLEVNIRAINGLYNFKLSEIDSITFGDNTKDVRIVLADGAPHIFNPLAFEGVEVSLSDNLILIQSTHEAVSYYISGKSDNMGIEVHSTKSYEVILQGSEITNSSGPALSLLGSEKITVSLAEGTQNVLTDGLIYTGPQEQYKGALHIGADGVLDGNGSLTIHSSAEDKQGIYTDGTMDLTGGNITMHILGDKSKGIKSEEDIKLTGGTLTIDIEGNTIAEPMSNGYNPSFSTGIKSDNNVLIDGCVINISLPGIAGKGISADRDILIRSGTVNIISSGDGSTYINEEGEPDAFYSRCMDADGNFTAEGGSITTESTGTAGRGITAEGAIVIGTTSSGPEMSIVTRGDKIHVSGEGNDAEFAEAKTIKSDGPLTIRNGTVIITSEDDAIKSDEQIDVFGGTIRIENTMEGLEAPFVNIHGGNIYIRSYDDGLNSSNGFDVDFNDGSAIVINGGSVTIDAVQGDGIDSNGEYHQNGGTVIVHGPPAHPEVGVDVNGEFLINEGFTIISGTNSPMTQSASASSVQNSLLAMSAGILDEGSLFHIEDMDGNAIVTFEPERAYYSVLFSSEALRIGTTYAVYTGGNYDGGIRNNGVLSQGNYSDGLLKTTFTIESKITQIDF